MKINLLKRLFLLIITIILLSCKKDNKKDVLSSDYFSIATNLKTLKNYKYVSINDTVKKVSGNFNQYEIRGFINNLDQKINWWNIVDLKKDAGYNVRLEYRIIDNKEKVNQFIFYHPKHGIYKINSKFYLKKKNKNILTYSFYTPSEYKKINSVGKFEYYIFIDNKLFISKIAECKKQDNAFFIDIPFPKTNKHVILKGLFSELFEDKDKKLGQNDIYVLDDLSVGQKPPRQSVQLFTPK